MCHASELAGMLSRWTGERWEWTGKGCEMVHRLPDGREVRLDVWGLSADQMTNFAQQDVRRARRGG